MFLTIILILVGVACFAALFMAGLWSNLLTLVNMIVAALIATNYFELLAAFFDRQESRLTYLWDFFSIWMIFIAAFSILRAATDYMSPVKVKFFVPVEKVGGLFFAVWCSWLMICFVTFTLHTAPLARNFLFDSFQPTPKDKMFFGLGPDRLWMAWVQKESKGTLSRLSGVSPFDPKYDFIVRYGNRRHEFDQQLTFFAPKAAGGTPGAGGDGKTPPPLDLNKLRQLEPSPPADAPPADAPPADAPPADAAPADAPPADAPPMQ